MNGLDGAIGAACGIVIWEGVKWGWNATVRQYWFLKDEIRAQAREISDLQHKITNANIDMGDAVARVHRLEKRQTSVMKVLAEAVEFIETASDLPAGVYSEKRDGMLARLRGVIAGWSQQ